jgi:hypothetical protein
MVNYLTAPQIINEFEALRSNIDRVWLNTQGVGGQIPALSTNQRQWLTGQILV